ncbi:Cytochrome c551 peroxidase [invertebrate metagenome]|uniref:Cytochrome c551 peroxidase n=1 Tax=invertebrate metagenome TaxID=1711999 RepID=A0A2H9T792_9ZZZZ
MMRFFLMSLLFGTVIYNVHGSSHNESEKNSSLLFLSGDKLETRLKKRTNDLGLTGNPSIDYFVPSIDSSSLAQLGRELFFSKSLSLSFETACASCHHPFLAGADGLSLPVGVGAIDPDIIGPGRQHDGNYSIDPEADGGPNIERNSPSTFNSSFYNYSIFMDGRVEAVEWHNGVFLPLLELDAYLSRKRTNYLTSKSGQRKKIKTPDSLFGGADPQAGNNLLMSQSRFPVVSVAEMRGFNKNIISNHGVRQWIEKRLQGKTGELITNRWEGLFRKGFNDFESPAEKLLTFDNIAAALTEYQHSQVFINTPWRRYLEGKTTLTEQAKRGALLFYTSAEQGGAGCVQCHSGDFFTNERFYNLAVPQFGRGNFVHGRDLGRQAITRDNRDYYAFRVPSLLNISETAPYGHTGAFNTLEEIIAHHLNPEASVKSYDYSLQQLPQFRGLKVSYPYARDNTQLALMEYLKVRKFIYPVEMAVNPRLKKKDILSLVAFLETLTDPCIQDRNCLTSWIPQGDPPDDHRLSAVIPNRFDNIAYLPVTQLSDTDHPQENKNKPLLDVPVFELSCRLLPENRSVRIKKGKGFKDSTKESGLRGLRTLDKEQLSQAISAAGDTFLQAQLFSGGMAVGDINGDCFNDLVMDMGDMYPLAIYMNSRHGTFTLSTRQWGLENNLGLSHPVLADLNNDGWLDLLTGSLNRKEPVVFLNNGRGQFVPQIKSGFRVGRNTMGAGLGDIDRDGDLDLFLAHWDRPSGAEEEHLWLNNGSGFFIPGARKFGLAGEFGENDFTFTPNFSDLNQDGWVDLLSTADYMTSQVFLNQLGKQFDNVTDKSVINDRNGMGAAIADFDNDGDVDWFVSSIFSRDITGYDSKENRLFKKYDGNRLYRNDSNKGGDIVFTDVTDQAGVRNGGWGWGSCAADFNNDGWVDIFHVNGFPFDPMAIRPDLQYLLDQAGMNDLRDVLSFTSYKNFQEGMVRLKKEWTDKEERDLKALYFTAVNMGYASMSEQFTDNRSKLFINNGDGTFSEQSQLYGITDEGQGRGVSCMDSDLDGDIDIFIVNNTGAPIYYRNNLGGDQANYLSIRLMDAHDWQTVAGSRIRIITTSGHQMREMRLESNYISQNAMESHFGLGDDRVVQQLTIVWPDQTKQDLYNIEVNQMLVVNKPPKGGG